jgi:hypothetical protein
MNTNIRKYLNLILISGEKRHFLFWKKKFEFYIYYTPRKRVIFCKIYGLKIKDLKLDFEIGDSIEKVIKWAEKNKYNYRIIEKNN